MCGVCVYTLIDLTKVAVLQTDCVFIQIIRMNWFLVHFDQFTVLTPKSHPLTVDLFPQQDMDDGAPPSKKGKLDSSSEAN